MALAEDARADTLAKSFLDEGWQKRALNQPYTRYAIGAMQAVDPDYTRISLETAERVGKQLRSGLVNQGFEVDFRLQGSVPLDVHIRGVSDVDLLNLDTSFLTYHGAGPRAGYYTSPTPKTSLSVLLSLRSAAETVLKSAFPKATVDTSGGKAIKVSGGSLARPVDVVPSHWHDSVTYQRTLAEQDRHVTILDKKVPTTLDNLPFKHIAAVRSRCNQTGGGLRKAIRLAKNVKADAAKEGTKIDLPSFDIAATMYHADQGALGMGQFYELAVLAEVQRHLDHLATNSAYARTLWVPDGSRLIFDTQAKFDGLVALSLEMDDLAREVAKEQKPLLKLYDGPSLADSRAAIANVIVPG